MKLLTSLLLGAFLTNFLVSALPFSGPPSESDIAEREDTTLSARNDLFADPKAYRKHEALDFAQDIPLHKLEGFKNSAHTIHSVGNTDKKKKRPMDGFRLDHQGMTTDGYHNLQVQINGHVKGKSTVGGILVKGDLSPGKIRSALTWAVKNPAKDGENQFLRKYDSSGKAPTDSNGKVLTNKKARKGAARKPKPRHPNSRKLRKAAKKKEIKALQEQSEKEKGKEKKK